MSFFYLLDHSLFFILPFSKSYFPNQTVSFTMVSHNDTTVHDDCADSSASSSASSSVDVHFDGPLGNSVVVTFTDKITGKYLSSYNQQDVLTHNDALSSFLVFHSLSTHHSGLGIISATTVSVSILRNPVSLLITRNECINVDDSSCKACDSIRR